MDISRTKKQDYAGVIFNRALKPALTRISAGKIRTMEWPEYYNLLGTE